LSARARTLRWSGLERPTMQLPIYQVDAFAERLFAGNPAAVCPLDAWLDEWVYGLADHAEYVEKMGAQLWDSLRPGPALSGEVDYGRYA